mmetsp:Transcript_61477/g.71839  ORF Transcript_61477/g.71839 Transcript_61477/m.71839 type:complete len:222 (+) Transcript_61477:166-831(+)|eukprot:CAMPEP_0194379324 /NCGR_PEP_ID=MMETSP0174-20130528/39223_1 /TAXON_ID=216777 /ORGANISM="Proboscia alata, Strain PI-D3" /LENGTH=221 /DNA_ID=CAMNT_0039161967 /DNA_START=129 /DNA_END=794 /DNA_ORIENTATION=+
MKTIIISLLGSAVAFNGSPVFHRPASYSSSRSVLKMGGATGRATTLEGKTEVVANVKTLLESSEMVFSMPASGLKVKEMNELRFGLPEGTTAQCVKNKLMQKAAAGTDYEAALTDSALLKGTNLWFFIRDDIGASIKSHKTFVKEFEKKESHGIIGGVIDGDTLDALQVVAVGALPSKKELITMIAARIKAVPTKVARVVKAPNAKLARAIKLATEKEEEE